MEDNNAVSSSPATQAVAPKDETPIIPNDHGKPDEGSCMYFIVQTDFSATYEWQGDAVSKEEASDKAYDAVATMDASDLWSKMYADGAEVKAVEPAVASILKHGCSVCGVGYRCRTCGSAFCDCPNQGVIDCHPITRPQVREQ
jgi:hypothetical protein